MASSTPEEWFHRCSGDWDQVRNADKLPGDFSGRCWYGLLGNFDEAYDFLLSLGLLSDPSTSSKDKAKSKVNPYQSAFNKLLQFGSSVRATKTAGSYGERPDRTISMGITCNMHPAQYIPMERGEKGSSLQFNSATRLIKSLAFSCFSGTSIAPLTAQELRGTTGSPSLLTLLSLSALPKKRHLRSGMARGRLRRCRRRAAHAECCPGVRAIRRGIPS